MDTETEMLLRRGDIGRAVDVLCEQRGRYAHKDRRKDPDYNEPPAIDVLDETARYLRVVRKENNC